MISSKVEAKRLKALTRQDRARKRHDRVQERRNARREVRHKKWLAWEESFLPEYLDSLVRKGIRNATRAHARGGKATDSMDFDQYRFPKLMPERYEPTFEAVLKTVRKEYPDWVISAKLQHDRVSWKYITVITVTLRT